MDSIDKAFKAVKRRNFVPGDLTGHAEYDDALPIGFGQTISQPTTVKLMLEWLEPEPADKILDVGSGSGWTSALLAYIVGPQGKIYALERIAELLVFGRANVLRQGFKNVSFFAASENLGLAKFAPYDRILVSAAAKTLPQQLIDQLRVGGKMVIPVGHDILEIEKQSQKEYLVQAHPGFVFVPLL